jgi:hypothetical protein
MRTPDAEWVDDRSEVIEYETIVNTARRIEGPDFPDGAVEHVPLPGGGFVWFMEHRRRGDLYWTAHADDPPRTIVIRTRLRWKPELPNGSQCSRLNCGSS